MWSSVPSLWLPSLVVWFPVVLMWLSAVFVVSCVLSLSLSLSLCSGVSSASSVNLWFLCGVCGSMVSCASAVVSCACFVVSCGFGGFL